MLTSPSLACVSGWLIFTCLYFFISICRTPYKTTTVLVLTLTVTPYESLKKNCLSSTSVGTAESTFQSPISGVCNIQTFTLQLHQNTQYINTACYSDLFYKYYSALATPTRSLTPPPLKLCLDRKNPLCKTFSQGRRGNLYSGFPMLHVLHKASMHSERSR